MRRALRLAGLAAALSLWIVAARASAESPSPSAIGVGPANPSVPAQMSSGPSPGSSAGMPARLRWEVVSSFPHDAGAWTEGLVIDDQGRLLESTGLVGRSSVRELDRTTGVVLRSAPPPGDEYGEGLAATGDVLLQLTWQDGVAFAWDPDTFQLVGRHPYAGEGWGLCSDGTRLVMSDGSATLAFRDPATFEVIGTLEVTTEGQPVPRLNELECVGAEVWANVWETPWIVRIDAASGVVTGVLDMTGLIEPDPAVADPGAVLNGIAHDPERGTFLVTGKLWPLMFEIRVTEP